jgi:hypothetical protein
MGQVAAVKLLELLETGGSTRRMKLEGGTDISYAVCNGHEAVFKPLD